MTKEEALKTYYGYDVFRGGQEAVIDALLSGRDALAIMPTGAGKSVCYQIPALLLPGITLVGHVVAENRGSRRVLEKNGFSHTETLHFPDMEGEGLCIYQLAL